MLSLEGRGYCRDPVGNNSHYLFVDPNPEITQVSSEDGQRTESFLFYLFLVSDVNENKTTKESQVRGRHKEFFPNDSRSPAL